MYERPLYPAVSSLRRPVKIERFEDECYHIYNIHRNCVFIEHGTCDNNLEVIISLDGNRH